jgi:hypothetical protein
MMTARHPRDEMPTTEELRVYLYQRIKTLDYTAVGFYSSSGSSTTLTTDTDALTTAWLSTLSAVKEDGGWTGLSLSPDERVPVTPLDMPQGLPDPITMLKVLRERKECRERYRAAHGADRYGIDVTLYYARRVMHARLVKVVGEDTEPVYQAQTDEGLRALLLPIPEDSQGLREYQSAVQELLILTIGWLVAGCPLVALDELEGGLPPTAREDVIERVVEVLESVARFDRMVQHQVDVEDTTMMAARPSRDGEIVAWVEHPFRAGETFRVSILDGDAIRTFSFTEEHVSSAETIRIGTSSGDEAVPLTWEEAREVRRPSWLFDPLTMRRSVVDRLPGHAHSLGPSYAQRYLKVAMKPYLSFLLAGCVAYDPAVQADALAGTIDAEDRASVEVLATVLAGWLGIDGLPPAGTVRLAGVSRLRRRLEYLLLALRRYYVDLGHGEVDSDESSGYELY